MKLLTMLDVWKYVVSFFFFKKIPLFKNIISKKQKTWRQQLLASQQQLQEREMALREAALELHALQSSLDQQQRGLVKDWLSP